MTITYPNGKVLQAIVLSHDENEIRASAPGCDDVLAFTCVEGIWISEDGQPVTIAFTWQRRPTPPSFSDPDFICPKQLAARLIGSLLWGLEPDKAVENTFFVFKPQGARVALQASELGLN